MLKSRLKQAHHKQKNTRHMFSQNKCQTTVKIIQLYGKTDQQIYLTLFRMACVKSRKPFSTFMFDFALVSRNGIPCCRAICSHGTAVDVNVNSYRAESWNISTALSVFNNSQIIPF